MSSSSRSSSSRASSASTVRNFSQQRYIVYTIKKLELEIVILKDINNILENVSKYLRELYNRKKELEEFINKFEFSISQLKTKLRMQYKMYNSEIYNKELWDAIDSILIKIDANIRSENSQLKKKETHAKLSKKFQRLFDKIHLDFLQKIKPIVSSYSRSI
jgi:hypothetical protein